MPRLSLTDFVDIVALSGSPKATKVREVKMRPEYEPAFDFYKQVREGIATTHRQGRPRSEIETQIGTIRDGKKIDHYDAVVTGYRKWWGRKAFEWIDPAQEVFSRSGIEISVNPELGLRFGNQTQLIKLYFKAKPLSKTKVSVTLHLMEKCLRHRLAEDVRLSVLDTRHSKLFTGTGPIPSLDAALIGEVGYIAALWPEL
jgi:hypothetical protein